MEEELRIEAFSVEQQGTLVVLYRDQSFTEYRPRLQTSIFCNSATFVIITKATIFDQSGNTLMRARQV